jgi:hypothetical protein
VAGITGVNQHPVRFSVLFRQVNVQNSKASVVTVDRVPTGCVERHLWITHSLSWLRPGTPARLPGWDKCSQRQNDGHFILAMKRQGQGVRSLRH